MEPFSLGNSVEPIFVWHVSFCVKSIIIWGASFSTKWYSDSDPCYGFDPHPGGGIEDNRCRFFP